MWCPACQQDTPGVASMGDESVVRCAQCGRQYGGGDSPMLRTVADDEVSEAAEAPAADASETAAAMLFDTSVFDLHNWRLDNDLADAERLIRSIRGAAPAVVDGNHDAPAAVRQLQSFPLPSSRSARRFPKRSGGAPKLAAFFSWVALSLGVMTFAGGAVLLAWSFFGGRSELWSFGLPLTLAGQAGLLIGLILQLEGLWQSNRTTAESLDALDDQLSDLRHAASILSTSHSTASQSFYAHMADGASPQMLLADLKGQLDLLAVRIAKERAA